MDYAVPDEVLLECLAQFKLDWESETCPHCKKAKWPNSPFCRRCSIRLQRRNLFRGYRNWTRRSLEVMVRFFGPI